MTVDQSSSSGKQSEGLVSPLGAVLTLLGEQEGSGAPMGAGLSTLGEQEGSGAPTDVGLSILGEQRGFGKFVGAGLRGFGTFPSARLPHFSEQRGYVAPPNAGLSSPSEGKFWFLNLMFLKTTQSVSQIILGNLAPPESIKARLSLTRILQK